MRPLPSGLVNVRGNQGKPQLSPESATMRNAITRLTSTESEFLRAFLVTHVDQHRRAVMAASAILALTVIARKKCTIVLLPAVFRSLFSSLLPTASLPAPDLSRERVLVSGSQKKIEGEREGHAGDGKIEGSRQCNFINQQWIRFIPATSSIKALCKGQRKRNSVSF